MKIKIRADKLRLWIPLPVFMVRFLVRILPASVFDEMKADIPKPYQDMFTKEVLDMIVKESLDSLSESKGLEIIHVEAADGTVISVTL